MNDRDVIKPGLIDALIDWPLLLADNELASPDDFWGEFEEPERVVMLRDHFSRRLVAFGIEPATYQHAMPDWEALHVLLYEMYHILDQVTKLIDREQWAAELHNGLWRLSQILALRLERQYQKSQRAKIARQGSRARGLRKRETIAEVVAQFDPGPQAGTKTWRAERVRERALKAGFKGADKLPKRLDKYLP